jgi:hypothetical protein
MSDFYNPLLEHRRIWECARDHGVILIVGLEEDVIQHCPLCNTRLSKSRPVEIVSVLSCPSPFRARQILPFPPA